jgi:hypothetical protein
MAKKKVLLPRVSAALAKVTGKRVAVVPNKKNAALLDVIVGRTVIIGGAKTEDARLLIKGLIDGVKLGMRLQAAKKK